MAMETSTNSVDHKGSNAAIEITKKKRQKIHINRYKTYLSTVVSGRR
jgi:hypothetical protein